MSDYLEHGMVALVGAGPGDVGLFTLRGQRLLEQADVVVYDYLSNSKLLAMCPGAQHLFVGKMAAKHSMTQDQINALLIEKAKAGHKVVRLKGGDPFVFGRGGEECEALAEAKIPYIIVPGITAAVAAAAYAGIPVTHRDFNSSFTLITGHEKEEDYQDPQTKSRKGAVGSSDLDWNAIARLPCIAFYMGVKSLPRISSKLIENGMNPDTPAATIQWGTMPKQRCVAGTIATLPDIVKKAGISAPAITIVGKVVSLRQALNWFESQPLFGKTIVVTRTRQQSSDLSRRLESLGATVIEAPTIEIVPPSDWKEIDTAVQTIGKPDGPQWVIFTSSSAVRIARDRLRELKLDARIFSSTKIAAIGDATAKALRDDLCITADCVPDRFVAEALADELDKRNVIKGNRFLLLRADIARPVLVERLQKSGAIGVQDINAYQTRIASSLPEELTEALAGDRVDWVTFTSSSTAKNMAILLGKNYRKKLEGVKLASIGPVTSQALTELGLTPTIQANQFDIPGLINAILQAK